MSLTSSTPQRFLDEHFVGHFLEDFAFLFQRIRDYYGELDLRLRKNSFNLYFRGCSLAKVDFRSPRKEQREYSISINEKFARTVFDNDKRFPPAVPTKVPDERSGRPQSNLRFRVPAPLLKAFFQKSYIDKLSGRITAVNYGEEIVFEQMLITDNLNREDIFLIDRQVLGGSLGNGRIDLLALRKQAKSKYSFLILEVKLGCNKELSGEVGRQVERYVDGMTRGFADWKACYERCYQQLRATRIHDAPKWDSVEIVEPVEGRIIVGGYSNRATAAVKLLKEKYRSIDVQQFLHRLQ